MHSRHDSREIIANARAGFLAKFLREVDSTTPGLPEAERLVTVREYRELEAALSASFETWDRICMYGCNRCAERVTAPLWMGIPCANRYGGGEGVSGSPIQGHPRAD
jgi:hypothetical protein